MGEVGKGRICYTLAWSEVVSYAVLNVVGILDAIYVFIVIGAFGPAVTRRRLEAIAG